MTNWDHETDLIVVGSGGGGMAAALTAKVEGLDPLVLEKTEYYGGTTSISGGGVWIPNNHLMAEAGIKDSKDDARTYLKSIVGEHVPDPNLEAFITHAPEMLRYLSKLPPIRFTIMDGYSDYYAEKPGGTMSGRGLMAPIFAGSTLGDMFDQLRPSPIQPPFEFALTISEIRTSCLAKAYLPFMPSAIKVFLRNLFGKIIGAKHVGAGATLIARMRMAMHKQNVPLWLNTPVKDIIIEDNSAIGVIAEKDGKKIRIRSKKGIVLAAGGFPHNKEMREKYQRHPISTEWTAASPGNTGEVIQMGINAGAKIGLMDDSWWGPTHFPPGDAPIFMVLERSYPGCIIVNSAGRRFINESTPYVDYGHSVYDANSENGSTIPSFLIVDQRYRSRYIMGTRMPGLMERKNFKNGYIIKADTIEGLAEKVGIDQAGLSETVKRFNGFAREGKDPDFGKGEAAYDRFYSDPGVKPNSCLAPLEKPPYYCVKLYPGDLGTKGGLVTDDRAQVVKEDGEIIKGLYAVGNTSASVMGNTYPGPGGSIGPAMTFGYVAALHAAGRL